MLSDYDILPILASLLYIFLLFGEHVKKLMKLNVRQICPEAWIAY